MVSFTCNNIIYYGGSLFTNGGLSIGDLKYLIRKIPFLSKKTSAMGVSVGPFRCKEDFETTRELLEQFKYVGVRDHTSIEQINKMGKFQNAYFSFDNAIMISNLYPELIKLKSNDDYVILGVSITRNESEFGRNTDEEKRREEILKNTLSELIRMNSSIKEVAFIEFNGNQNNGDSEVTNEFYDFFKGKINSRIISYSKDTRKMLSEISQCNFIIGTRLHAGIIAYVLKIPFMLIEYHNKCTEFLNTVNHNIRFDLNNYENNVSRINEMINLQMVPGIKEPEFFKDIMIKQIIYLKGKL